MVIAKLTGNQPIMIPEQCSQRNEGVMFHCATKDNKIEATLPSIKSLNYSWVDIKIADADGNCEENTITISPAGNDLINGKKDPIILKNNGAGVLIMPFSQTDWKCIVFD